MKAIEQVRYWFEEALNVATVDRRAFIQQNCKDAEVRAEVLSLVQCDVAGATVPRSVRSAIGTVLGGIPPTSRVGAFELGRLLGSGGMGFVYEGHRADGQVRQRVAIKFAQVSPSASDAFRDSVRRRFARERQLLASLRHPYIAGLIDAGTTPDGIPYAVIEQVDGVPIDVYCDRSLPHHADRIRLFLKLCEAVQFAHRNLVVHSDIKPENVLVTADGNPKLIDFGVASDLANDPASVTLRAFTPGYASPEQCLGLAATVATDVYGLGAVLYRLLTGAVPRRLRTESLEEAIRQISEEEILHASAIRPELRGDLENILVKALHREPNRRYGSVPEFADDLNRYLARRPVSASPDSILYRSSRFVRRHWITLGAGAMLAAAMTMATAVSLHQRHEAVKRAAETRQLAEQLLFEVHDQIGTSVDGTIAREKVGEIAVHYLERSERDWKRDPDLAWELLNAYSRLAQSRGGGTASVGDSRSAIQLAVKALALGRVIEDSAPTNERLDNLFSVYGGLVPVFMESKRLAEERDAIDRMLRLAPRLGPLREAEALKHLARFFDEQRPAEAAEAWRRSLAVLRTMPEARETRAQLISTLAGYGRAQNLSGDFDGAAASLREAIRLAEARIASEPPSARSARQLYWSRLVLGDVLGSTRQFSLGRTADALAEYRKAREIVEQLERADPASDTPKLDLARALRREASALAPAQPALAVAALERARGAAARTSPRNYSGLEAQFLCLVESVAPLTRLSRLETARARLSEARRLARDLQREGFEVREENLLRAEAVLLFAEGRRPEALEQAKRDLALRPTGTSAVLSENYSTLESLDRVRMYAAGTDPETSRTAAERIERIWKDLRASYPNWAFLRAQMEQGRVHATNDVGGFNSSAARRR